MKITNYLASVANSLQHFGYGALFGVAICSYKQAYPESNIWTWGLPFVLIVGGLVLEWTMVLWARRNRIQAEKSAS
jgi:hypothetical protein